MYFVTFHLGVTRTVHINVRNLENVATAARYQYGSQIEIIKIEKKQAFARTSLDALVHNGEMVADRILCWGHLLVNSAIRPTDILEATPPPDYACDGNCDFFEGCPAVIRNE